MIETTFPLGAKAVTGVVDVCQEHEALQLAAVMPATQEQAWLGRRAYCGVISWLPVHSTRPVGNYAARGQSKGMIMA
jgi:hypothetical protein